MNIFNFFPFLASDRFQVELFSNTLAQYIETLILLVLLLILFRLIQFLIISRIKKFSETTTNDIDDAFSKVIQTVKPSFYFFLSFYLASKSLVLPAIAQSVINWVLVLWLGYQIVTALQVMIDYLFGKKIASEDPGTAEALKTLSTVTKIVLWIIASLFILSNMGVEITSVVAGLGIGGIAIAFALQNILEDLFSSFAIFFDKPFVVGDFIVIGDKTGTVEKIGIKTTRLRALQGEEITLSNKELMTAQIQNFKKMEERRISFHLGVTYETPHSKLEKVPTTIADIIGAHPDTRFDRAHFFRFDDSALTFEIVYYVLSSDYGQYMNIQQDINLKLKQVFDEQKIDFAYPTQTLYLTKTK